MRTSDGTRVEDDYELADTLRSIDEDLRDLAAPGADDGDPTERLADQLLTEAGMASKPQKVGGITTVSRLPQVDRTSDQYRYLRDRVRVALEIEAQLARDLLTTGERSAPKDPQFNPAGGAPVRVGVSGDERRLSDPIAVYKAERVTLYGEESTSRKFGLLFRVLEDILEFERDLLIERTQAGLARARASGTVVGRPPALTEEQRRAVLRSRREGMSLGQLAKQYSVSRAAIQRVEKRST